MHILYVDIWWKGYSLLYFSNIRSDALRERKAEGERGGGGGGGVDRWKDERPNISQPVWD